MDPRSQQLITDLYTRFGYTADNTRDLVGDSTFSFTEVLEELEVERAVRIIDMYLSRCDHATDVACWD